MENKLSCFKQQFISLNIYKRLPNPEMKIKMFQN